MSRISNDELQRLIGAATPGPWLAANNPGDWGLAGAWSITPPNGNPYEWDQCIAHVEYTTPYCAGASKAEIDAAGVAQSNARLIALAPALAAEVLQLRKHLADLLDACEQMGLSGGNLAAARATISDPVVDAMNRRGV